MKNQKEESKLKNEKYLASFLKTETSPIFASWFKNIVMNKTISLGCKVYLLSFALLPRRGKYSPTRHGKKIGRRSDQFIRWRNEAEKAGIKAGL